MPDEQVEEAEEKGLTEPLPCLFQGLHCGGLPKMNERAENI